MASPLHQPMVAGAFPPGVANPKGTGDGVSSPQVPPQSPTTALKESLLASSNNNNNSQETKPLLSSPAAASSSSSAPQQQQSQQQQQQFNIVVDDGGMIPVKTLLLHLLLFACSGLLIAFALTNIGMWAALLAGFVCFRFGTMRFPTLLISALGISNSTDAVAEALKRCDTMAQPNSKKHTFGGKSANSSGGVSFACSSMQGWRRSMEDAHSAVLDLKALSSSSTTTTLANNNNSNTSNNNIENNAGGGEDEKGQKLSGQGKNKKNKESLEQQVEREVSGTPRSASSPTATLNNNNTSASGGDSAEEMLSNNNSTTSTLLDNTNNNTNSFFAVFDGHSGSTIAQFCGSMLPQFVVDTDAYKKGKFGEALREAYITIDKHLSQHPTFRDDRSGCTAISILLTPTDLFCANAGDSRAVLCRNGRAVPLSIDHKPTLPGEKKRIERAKSIVHNRRVNGILALSRAIGDFSFKRRPFIPWEEQAVTCVPDVVSSPIHRDVDEFIIIACDGIWDVMSNEAVISFVRTRLLRGVAPGSVCEMLMEACLSNSPFGLGCDNMSVIIILLKGTHEMKSIVEKELN
jgi:protein phosphatase 2C family protein 2/3